MPEGNEEIEAGEEGKGGGWCLTTGARHDDHFRVERPPKSETERGRGRGREEGWDEVGGQEGESGRFAVSFGEAGQGVLVR